jgi:hypothetical protein
MVVMRASFLWPASVAGDQDIGAAVAGRQSPKNSGGKNTEGSDPGLNLPIERRE